MLVSVFSDASLCHETRACGIACWVRSNRIGKGQIFSQAIENWTLLPDQAEICAAVYGLFKATEINAAKYDDHVLLQSDCMSVKNFLKLPIAEIERRGRQYDLELKRFYNELLSDTGIRVYFRHVRGHSSEKGRRFKVNKMCDSLARKEMDKIRRVHVGEIGASHTEAKIAEEDQ